MCELFGVSSGSKVQVNGMLKEFFSHSDRHPNGWGLALFYGNAVSLEKEPVQASRSSYLKERLRHRMEPTSMMAHIRFATIGNMEYANCHPFVRRDASDRTWTLIHNGTIFEYPALSPYQYQQEGSTDSERILYYLVDQIDKRQAALGRPMDQGERFGLMDGLIRDMARGNKLNLMLYDGELMYVHTNYADSLYVSESSGTAVFATVPLRGGHWKPVPFTTLCAYEKGKQVFQGEPHGQEYRDNDKDTKYLFAAYAQL